MRIFHIFPKLSTHFLLFAVLTASVLISANGYNKDYEHTLGILNSQNSESEFLCTADSFPHFTDDGKVKFFGKIENHEIDEFNGKLIYFSIKNIDFKFGKNDILKIKAKIYPASDNGNEGAFDYAEYLKSQNCIGVCYPDAKSAHIYTECEGLLSAIFKMRQKFIDSANKSLPKRNSSILCAVICGDRTEMDTKCENALKTAGIYHIAAISGLHLNLFIYIVFSAISKLKLKRSAKTLLSLSSSLLIGLFILIFTGMGISVIRAFLMMLILNLSTAMPRKPNGKYALILTTYIILTVAPYNLYSVSFKLSALSTLGVLTSSDIIRKLKNRRIWSFIHSTYIGNTLTVSVTTTLFTLPVTYSSFGYIPTYSFIANALVLPVMGYFLGLGAVYTAVTVLSVPVIPIILAKFLYLISEYIFFISYWVSSLPMPTIYIYLNYVNIAILILAVFLICCYTYKRCKNKSALFICASVASISVVLCAHPFLKPANGKIVVSYLDAGQGDCTIVSADRHNIMIDCGTLGNTSYTLSAIESFMRVKSIKSFDTVFVSHFHEDHTNMIPSLIKKSKIKTVVLPRYFNHREKEAKEMRDQIIDACIKTGTKVCFATSGKEFKIANNAKIDIISVLENEKSTNNDMSVIMKLSYGKSDFMFFGDAGNAVLNTINPQEHGCNVIKVPHHGGYCKNTLSYLLSCNAQYAVISCGKNNRYGHPDSRITNTLEENGITYFRTDTDGAVTVTADSNENFCIETVR